MAKSIKALKCPQCGSPQKAEVRPDHFRCESCGTEYFLDNDDININYTERKIGPTAIPLRAKQLAAIVLGSLLLVLLLSWLFRSDPRPVYEAASRPVVAEEKIDISYRWSSTQEQLYLNSSRQPVLFVIGPRRYTISGSRRGIDSQLGVRDSCFASFYDATTGQELQSIPLPELNAKNSPELRLAAFESGKLYVIVNKTRIYEVDKSAYNLQDVSQTLFQGQSELSSGIASLEKIHHARNDGFTLMTNDGRSLLFYPAIGQVYTEKAYYKARGNMSTLPANSPTETRFVFSTKSTDYSDEKLQLISYQYRNNVGGPQEPPRFSWSRDYGRAGIFNGSEPHKKSLVNAYNVQQMRLLSYQDFTPGRLYFSPEVMHADAGQVLIRFRPTAADGSAPVVQALDAQTGAIKFTAPLPEGFRVEQALRYADGYALRDDRVTLLLGPDGTFRKPVSIL